MPIYEYSCRACGHRFEELVGSHVGTDAGDIACPECGATDPERRVASPYATTRQLTPGQRRRLEGKRDIQGGGAKQRFQQQRAAEKRAAGRRSGPRGNR
jgi:putative FmdB family regulatory protein